MDTSDNILKYTGQSVLYDLFFFVPRVMWKDKPVMYCKNFTGYVYAGDGDSMQLGNLQVNIWTEYVSNFGVVFGHFIALLLIFLIVKMVENTPSILSKITGCIFILIYMTFGFESIVLYVYLFWVLSYFLPKRFRLLTNKKQWRSMTI